MGHMGPFLWALRIAMLVICGCGWCFWGSISEALFVPILWFSIFGVGCFGADWVDSLVAFSAVVVLHIVS